MSYPAYEAFGRDIQVGYQRWRVYMALQPPVLVHFEAREVKVWALAERLHMSRRHVIPALDWLVQSGYLVEQARGSNRVRRFVLAHTLSNQEQFPQGTTSPAA